MGRALLIKIILPSIVVLVIMILLLLSCAHSQGRRERNPLSLSRRDSMNYQPLRLDNKLALQSLGRLNSSGRVARAVLTFCRRHDNFLLPQILGQITRHLHLLLQATMIFQ
jgi:hypothetical protein